MVRAEIIGGGGGPDFHPPPKLDVSDRGGPPSDRGWEKIYNPFFF